MADRTTNIKIGVTVDQNSVKVTSASLRQMSGLLTQDTRKQAQLQNKIVADAAKEQARTQTTLTREATKQQDIVTASVRKNADAQTRAVQSAYTQQKREMDARARYEFQSGQKSLTEYKTYLKAEETAAGASYQRRSQLIQRQQQLDRRNNPSVFRAGVSAAGSAVSVLGSAAAIRTQLQTIDRVTTLASDLNESRDKARVVFREAAKDIDAWAEHADDALGLTKTKAIDAASSIGNLLRIGGLTGKAGVDESKKIVQRAIDTASVYNLDVSDALEKVISGLQGQAKPLRAVGVFLNENRVKAEAFAQGYAKPIKDGPAIARAHEAVNIAAAKAAIAIKKYGDGSVEAHTATLTLDNAQARLDKTMQGSTKELTEQQKMLARISLYFKDSANQAGNFRDTSEAAANAQRRWNAQLENLEINLGEKFLPLKKELLSFLNGLLEKFNALDESTKNFAISTVAIGGIGVPLAVGVGNIVAQLLRIRAAYVTIKAAQDAANLSTAGGAAGGIAGTAAKGAAIGLGARFAGAAVSTLPITAPILIAGGLAYAGAQGSISNSENDIANTQLGTKNRIAYLKGKSADAQKRINDVTGAGGGSTDPYAASIQKRLIDDLNKEKAGYDNELGLMTAEYARETRNLKTQREARAKVAAEQKKKDDAALAATRDPGNKSVPSLYSGAARNAAEKASERAATKAQREAAKSIANDNKAFYAWYKFLNHAAELHTKDLTETKTLNSQADALRAQGKKAIEEATLASAKVVLDSVPDAEEIAALTQGGQSVDEIRSDLRTKIVEAETLIAKQIQAIYDAEIDRLEAEYDKNSARQPGDSDNKAAARQNAAYERMTAGVAQASRVRTGALDALDKQGNSARRQVQEGVDKQTEEARRQIKEAMQSKAKFLDAENKTLSREIRIADENGDFEHERQLVNQRLINEQDQAAQTLMEGWLTGDVDKIAEANEQYIQAAESAADALRQIALDSHDPAAVKEQARIERLKSLDTTAKGRGRFVTGPDGFTYDTKRDNGQTGDKRDLRRVDGAAIEAAAALTDAAKQNGGEFLKSLFTGDNSRDALKNFGKNLGRDFAETGADYLQKKLISGPIDKLFDSITDKIEGAFSKGGKEASGNIAGAALLLSNAGNFLGKNGKKKQRNSLLGAAIGFGLGSILPGVGNLEGAGLGASLFAGFANGGMPEMGRAVLVGEQGPELAVFNRPTQIIPAQQTAQMLSGAGGRMGGGTVNNFYGPMLSQHVDTIHDRADSDRQTEALTNHFDAFMQRTGG